LNTLTDRFHCSTYPHVSEGQSAP